MMIGVVPIYLSSRKESQSSATGLCRDILNQLLEFCKSALIGSELPDHANPVSLLSNAAV
jgi:hypothetical protein